MATGTSTTTDIRADENMRIEDDTATTAAVSSPEDAPVARDPRAEIMNDIYANRNAQLERELGIAADSIESTDGANVGDANDKNVVDIATEDPKPAPVAAQPEGPARKKLIVNGQERELSEDDIIKAAQMGLASQQTWQEAAEMKRQALVMMGMAQTNTQPAPAAPASQNSGQSKSAGVPLIDEDRLKKFDQSLNYGSEEERLNALRDLVGDIVTKANGQPAQGLTQQELVAAATHNALVEFQRQNNLNVVASEFSDVFQDHILSNAAGNLTQQLRQHYATIGQPKADLELMREALGTVRTKYLKPSAPAIVETTQSQNPPVQAASNVLPMKEKLERKRAAPQPPAAASKVASEQSAPQAPTGSQIVNQMRKARHQPAYN